MSHSYPNVTPSGSQAEQLQRLCMTRVPRGLRREMPTTDTEARRIDRTFRPGTRSSYRETMWMRHVWTVEFTTRSFGIVYTGDARSLHRSDAQEDADTVMFARDYSGQLRTRMLSAWRALVGRMGLF